MGVVQLGGLCSVDDGSPDAARTDRLWLRADLNLAQHAAQLLAKPARTTFVNLGLASPTPLLENVD